MGTRGLRITLILIKLILGLHASRILNELCLQCVVENNCVWFCLRKLQSSLLSELQIAPKYRILKAFPSICVWRDSCLWQVAQGFSLSHLDHPSDAQQWRTQLVCLFWDWLFLESNHDSLLTSILFRFRRDKFSRWNFLLTVHYCLAMQDWLYSLNVFEFIEGTGISEDSSGSSNLETFSSVPHLSPELISICHLTNTEHWRFASSFRLTNIVYRLMAFSCIHQ